MTYLLSIFVLFFTLSTSLFAQQTVKELDKFINNETKHTLKRYKPGKGGELHSVYVFKRDKSIFSVMKIEKFKTNERLDSVLSYQFGYINDTLLRVWFSRTDQVHKTNGLIIAYISRDKVIDFEKTGEVYLPSMFQIRGKSNELKGLAENYVASIN